uniref:Cytosolic phospholipase A2 zeta-like n=1 Tax=Salmo trutta TaxID=8032 RepID=A0A673WZF2_SALTR
MFSVSRSFYLMSVCVSPPLSLPISQEDVPNIALLGSGGGERAAVGMLGSLHQLAQDNLLGSLLYMCGVSGTTWCMSSLYSDPDWSLNKRCDEVIKKLKGPTVGLKKAVDWLKHVWFMCMDTRRLSDDAHRNSTNPYPIYSAIELNRNKQHCTEGDSVWFEMTPHESGFSGLGAFVPTSCFRSQFEDGIMTEKRKEMDMVLLQGVCGSAIADRQMDTAYVGKKIWHVLFEGKLQCIALVSLQEILAATTEFNSELIDLTLDSRDAALKMNSPYPPILRTSRKVDLIISLDFSKEDPFETVFSAKQYADELKLHFPPVKESVREEKDHPQDCYVFEGRCPEEPTIMHMPLFNLRNCKGLW